MNAVIWTLVAVLGAAATFAAIRFRRRGRRRREAMELAADLLPEIRALMESVDPNGPSGGEPAPPRRYQARHDRLPILLSKEDFFAVETFYHSVESYRGARTEVIAAFAEDDERSLGDRIRASDHCLKDLYYTGHAAVEKLEKLKASKGAVPF